MGFLAAAAAVVVVLNCGSFFFFDWYCRKMNLDITIVVVVVVMEGSTDDRTLHFDVVTDGCYKY